MGGAVAVETHRIAQVHRSFAVALPLLVGGEPLGAEAPAAPQLEEPLVVVAADLAALDQVADEGHLIVGESDALGDLGIGQAQIRALALDGGEVLQPDRVALGAAGGCGST